MTIVYADGYSASCPDCAVVVGEAHVTNCDVAKCPVCGTQVLGHGDEHGGDEHDVPPTYWTGFWPGTIECRERGWYVVWGPPWLPVPPGTPNATEDLNRWAYFRQTGTDRFYEDVVRRAP